MAINPPGGGSRQIRVEVFFDINRASAQAAGQAVQNFGVRPLTQLGTTTQQAAQSQQRLQEAFARSILGLRNWESQVGRSERTVNAFLGTFERFMRGGLALTPEQSRVFEALQRQAAGYAAIRKAGSDIAVEGARREEAALQRLQLRLQEISKLRASGLPQPQSLGLERQALQQAVRGGAATPEIVRQLDDVDRRIAALAPSIQRRLQDAFNGAVAGVRNWEAQVGRSEVTVRRLLATFESFLRRGLVMTPEQGQMFEALQRQAAGYAAVRKAGSDTAVEATRREERALQQLQMRLQQISQQRMAGLDPTRATLMERQALRSAVGAGVSQPDVIRQLRDVEQQAGKTGLAIRVLGEELSVARIFAWGLAWNQAYQALNLLTDLIRGTTIGSLQRFAEFQQRQIALAAEFVNLDPSVPFDRAMRAAGGLQRALIELQPGFIGTQEQLQEVLQAAIRFTGQVDLTSERGRRAFLAVANGIVAAQIGINRAGSSFREFAALFEGIQRPGAQFLTLLTRLDPEIVKNVRSWQEQGRVVEGIGDLLRGNLELAERMRNTLQGQTNTLRANIVVMQRDLGALFSIVVIPALKTVNFLLEQQNAIAQRRRQRETNILGALGVGEETRARLAGVGIGQEELDTAFALRLRRAQTVRVVAQFAESVEGAQTIAQHLFQTGQIGAEGFRDALLNVVRIAQKEFDAALARNDQNVLKFYGTLVQTQNAVEQFDFQMRQLAQERRLFEDFDVPISEARRRMQATQALAGQQAEMERIRSLEMGRLSRLETIRAQTADPTRQLQLDREILAQREKIASVEENITGKIREQRRVREQAAVEELRLGQREFAARLLELEIRRGEDVRTLQGNRDAMLAVERRYVLERLQILNDAATRLKEVEATLGRARLQGLEAVSELRQERIQFDITGLQPTGQESVAQTRERFAQIRRLQQQLQEEQARPVRARVERRDLPLEEQAQARARLSRLILEQAQAQSELNRQEADAIKNAKDRDLAKEIQILERRIQLMQRLGAAPERIEGIEKQLSRAQRLQELRGLPLEVLQEELSGAQQLLRQPGIDRKQFDAIKVDIGTIEEAIRDATAAQAKQVELTQQQQRELGVLEGAVRSINDQIIAKASEAAKRAQQEYDSLFTFIRDQLQRQVELWSRAGDAAGRAFAEAARVHLQNVFPVPGVAPGGMAPVPIPERLREGPITVNLNVTGTPQGPTVVVGQVDVTDAMSQNAVNELVGAILGVAGNSGVQRDRRLIPADTVA